MPQVEPPSALPVIPETPEPESRSGTEKKTPVLIAVSALIGVLFLVGAYLLWPKPEVKVQPSAASKTDSPLKTLDPQEDKQRDAIQQAERSVAAGDLKGALQAVLKAAKLHWRLSSDVQRMQGQ